MCLYKTFFVHIKINIIKNIKTDSEKKHLAGSNLKDIKILLKKKKLPKYRRNYYLAHKR